MGTWIRRHKHSLLFYPSFWKDMVPFSAVAFFPHGLFIFTSRHDTSFFSITIFFDLENGPGATDIEWMHMPKA